MSERPSVHGGEPRGSITEDEARGNLELRARYLLECLDKIDSGEPVWMLRNFGRPSEFEPGMVVDYYKGGWKRGFIVGSDGESVGWEVYWMPVDEIEGMEGPQHLSTGTIELRSEAQKILQDHVSKSLLK